MVALHYNFQVQGYCMFRFFSVHIALADVRFLWGKLGKLEKEKRTTFSNHAAGRSLLWFFVSKIGGEWLSHWEKNN